MKKLLLSVAAMVTMHFSALAQLPYSFSTTVDTYQPLTNGTLLTDTMAWDDDTAYIVTIPFTFKVDGVTVPQIILSSGNMAVTDTGAGSEVFVLMSAPLVDRGISTTSQKSASPIRYDVSGTVGSRIFKLEVFNAGFADEWYDNGSTSDYVHLQLWLYEADNSFEYRYGTSQINNFSSYFPVGVLTGFALNANMSTGDVETFYILDGNSSSPSIDTFSETKINQGLTAFPTSGRVYRFAPKTTSINSKALLSAVKVYPTKCNDVLMVEQGNDDALGYSVVGLNGTVYQAGTLGRGTTRIDVSNLAAGMYLLSMEHDGVKSVQRFVKL